MAAPTKKRPLTKQATWETQLFGDGNPTRLSNAPARNFLIIDGAMGTELERRGFDINKEPMWATSICLKDPMGIAAIHVEYFAAGADLCTANTYQMSVDGAQKQGTTVGDVAQLAVALVHAAVDTMEATEKVKFVGGSLGPVGSVLDGGQEFKGEYSMTAEEYEGFHWPRMLALLQPTEGAMGANKFIDVLQFETQPRLDEAVALASMLNRHNAKDMLGSSDLPPRRCFISFTTLDGERTAAGTPWMEVVDALAKFPCVAGIGINCSDPVHADKAVRQLLAIQEQDLKDRATKARAEPLAIIAYPNSGEVFDGETRSWKPGSTGEKSHAESAAVFAEWYRVARNRPVEVGNPWVFSGALVAGGCCRSTPQHIAAIGSALDNAARTLPFANSQ